MIREEDLIGHLLKANDTAIQAGVDRAIADDPAIPFHLSSLRKALAPLASDREAIPVPSTLFVNTIAAVANAIVDEEKKTADELPAIKLVKASGKFPIFPGSDSATGGASWSRQNVFALIGISLALFLVVFPVVVQVKAHQNQLVCQNNLRQFHQSLIGYSEVNGGRLPQVVDGEKVSTVVAILRDSGQLSASDTVLCPGCKVDSPEQRNSLGSYAYSLGFREHGNLCAIQTNHDNSLLPILADAPRRDGTHTNPINHRMGQNILHVGGHVTFSHSSRVGAYQDDIFTNDHGKIGAGLHKFDASLGRCEDRP